MPVDVKGKTIRIRQKDPKDYVRFRTKELSPGITAVIGFKEGGGSEIQSYVFDETKFTLAQAKAWVKKHEGTVNADRLGTMHIANMAMEPWREDPTVKVEASGPNSRWFWKELIRPGKCVHPQKPGVEIEFSPERMRQWAENREKHQVPTRVSLVHLDGQPMLDCGWVRSIYIDEEDGRTFGLMEITEPEVAAKIANGTIQGSSIGVGEIPDFRTGEMFEALEHVEITNQPWWTGLGTFEEVQRIAADRNAVGFLIDETENALDEGGTEVVVPPEDMLSPTRKEHEGMATKKDDVATVPTTPAAPATPAVPPAPAAPVVQPTVEPDGSVRLSRDQYTQLVAGVEVGNVAMLQMQKQGVQLEAIMAERAQERKALLFSRLERCRQDGRLEPAKFDEALIKLSALASQESVIQLDRGEAGKVDTTAAEIFLSQIESAPITRAAGGQRMHTQSPHPEDSKTGLALSRAEFQSLLVKKDSRGVSDAVKYMQEGLIQMDARSGMAVWAPKGIPTRDALRKVTG